MEPSIYRFSLCAALPLMLFFGFYFLLAKTPEKKIFKNYLRSRQIMDQCEKYVVKTEEYVELCAMKQWQVLKTVFPEVITDNFEFTGYEESADRLDYWLDERGYMSREDYKSGSVREYGFTEERVVQDFPIRGKAVYLHVRRRKWRDTRDGSIFTYDYELNEEGSRLTPEFVAFLKGTD